MAVPNSAAAASMARQKNVEFKARLADVDAFRHVVEVGKARTHDVRELVQIDEYVHLHARRPDGKTTDGSRLKLRTQWGSRADDSDTIWELVSYARPSETGETRESAYDVIAVPSYQAAQTLLAAFTVEVRVYKTRLAFVFRTPEQLGLGESTVRIHADTINELKHAPEGPYFVEVEGVLDLALVHSGDACKSMRRFVEQLRAELGVADVALERRSYRELVLAYEQERQQQASTPSSQ